MVTALSGCTRVLRGVLPFRKGSKNTTRRTMKVIIPGVVAGIATAALVSLAPAANADSGQTVMIRPGDFVQALSDTRSAGHVDFLKEGLHVKTDDTTSNSKAAEYFSVPTQG